MQSFVPQSFCFKCDSPWPVYLHREPFPCPRVPLRPPGLDFNCDSISMTTSHSAQQPRSLTLSLALSRSLSLSLALSLCLYEAFLSVSSIWVNLVLYVHPCRPPAPLRPVYQQKYAVVDVVQRRPLAWAAVMVLQQLWPG